MNKPEPVTSFITSVLHSEEAATLSIAMICLLEFSKELAQKYSHGVHIDPTVLDEMVKRHVLAAKSSEGQGMSIQQEAKVIGEAVKLLENLLSQVVAAHAKPANGCDDV